jgi:hypothetical protein
MNHPALFPTASAQHFRREKMAMPRKKRRFPSAKAGLPRTRGTVIAKGVKARATDETTLNWPILPYFDGLCFAATTRAWGDPAQVR